MNKGVVGFFAGIALNVSVQGKTIAVKGLEFHIEENYSTLAFVPLQPNVLELPSIPGSVFQWNRRTEVQIPDPGGREFKTMDCTRNNTLLRDYILDTSNWNPNRIYRLTAIQSVRIHLCKKEGFDFTHRVGPLEASIRLTFSCASTPDFTLGSDEHKVHQIVHDDSPDELKAFDETNLRSVLKRDIAPSQHCANQKLRIHAEVEAETMDLAPLELSVLELGDPL